MDCFQFMENWCYDEDTALGMGHHYVSGQPLPREMLDKLRGARVHMAGIE
jgi:oligopeptidase A